jgi:hypothetical protein
MAISSLFARIFHYFSVLALAISLTLDGSGITSLVAFSARHCPIHTAAILSSRFANLLAWGGVKWQNPPIFSELVRAPVPYPCLCLPTGLKLCE